MVPGSTITERQFSAADRQILESAQKHLNEEAYQCAITEFKTLLSGHPDLVEAQVGLGDGYFGLGNYEMAESAYRTGLEISCDNADGLFGLELVFQFDNEFKGDVGDSFAGESAGDMFFDILGIHEDTIDHTRGEINEFTCGSEQAPKWNAVEAFLGDESSPEGEE